MNQAAEESLSRIDFSAAGFNTPTFAYVDPMDLLSAARCACWADPGQRDAILAEPPEAPMATQACLVIDAQPPGVLAIVHL